MTDPIEPDKAPDVGSGVEPGPDISIPPDDEGTPIVDDPTPGGD